MSTQSDPLASWQPPQVNPQSDPFPNWQPPGYQEVKSPTNQKSDMDLIMEGISKLPKSTIKLLAGPMGQGDEQPTGKKSNEGYTEGPSIQNLLKNIRNSLSSTGNSLVNTFGHPLESFAQDPASTLATIGGGVQGLKEGGSALLEKTPVGAVAKGAAKGAYQELAAPSPTGFGYIAKALSNVPGGATLLKAIVGKYAGQAIGGIVGDSELGGHIGAATGITVPAIRGAIRGGKAGLAEYNLAPSPIDPRIQSIIDRLNY
jgi:hypothetical protein